jgi:hypothetical protein
MARLPDEIESVAHEIFGMTKGSSTPLTMFGFEIMNLLRQMDWQPQDVEQVGGLVIELLMQHGWKRQQSS